ncbi:MAG TPA: hypothetical protein VL688_07575 [Verrucomicrobiae bacterium]|nr:hypothetical protein [Verrucomicrobiae bacterium]
MRKFQALIFFFVLTFAGGILHADDATWQELENWSQSHSSSDGETANLPSDTGTYSGLSGTSSEAPSETTTPSASSSEEGRIVQPALTQPVSGEAPAAPARHRRKAPVVGGLTRVPTYNIHQETPAVAETAPAAPQDTPSEEPAAEQPQEPEVTAAPAAEEQPETAAAPAIEEQPEEPAPAPAPKPAAPARASRAAKEKPAPPSEENIFAKHFVLNPDQKLTYKTTEIGGFVFVETPGKGGVPTYAAVTNFGGSALQAREMQGIQDTQTLKKWVKDNTEVQNFEGADIRILKMPGEDGQKVYFVGNKAFPSLEKAQAEVAMVQAAVQASGGDFNHMVDEAEAYVAPPEAPEAINIPSPAEFEKQEKLFLKMLDALDVGEKNFGPFQGEGQGEAVTWQSFGETSFRTTNLTDHDYNAQVGFWTNRVVVKGIRAPLSTIDPFVEITGAMESEGSDFKDNLRVFGGLEWRPFSQNPWLVNYRPWSLPLLEWVRNFRFYVMYGDLFPLHDEIENSRDSDLNAGVQIFYEWGIDLPAAGEGKRSGIPDFLREFMWGEYFGNYRYEKTNFSSEEDFDAFIFNSSVILGFRLPGIPLPPNPINDELVLMPYMRFEHVNNSEFSFPYQNQYFVGAGVRWMPFRSYRYKENEWLSKVKIFGEYVGVGKVQNAKQDGEAPYAIRDDWRIGVSFSSRRF